MANSGGGGVMDTMKMKSETGIRGVYCVILIFLFGFGWFGLDYMLAGGGAWNKTLMALPILITLTFFLSFVVYLASPDPRIPFLRYISMIIFHWKDAFGGGSQSQQSTHAHPCDHDKKGDGCHKCQKRKHDDGCLHVPDRFIAFALVLSTVAVLYNVAHFLFQHHVGLLGLPIILFVTAFFFRWMHICGGGNYRPVFAAHFDEWVDLINHPPDRPSIPKELFDPPTPSPFNKDNNPSNGNYNPSRLEAEMRKMQNKKGVKFGGQPAGSDSDEFRKKRDSHYDMSGVKRGQTADEIVAEELAREEARKQEPEEEAEEQDRLRKPGGASPSATDSCPSVTFESKEQEEQGSENDRKICWLEDWNEREWRREPRGERTSPSLKKGSSDAADSDPQKQIKLMQDFKDKRVKRSEQKTEQQSICRQAGFVAMERLSDESNNRDKSDIHLI